MQPNIRTDFIYKSQLLLLQKFFCQFEVELKMIAHLEWPQNYYDLNILETLPLNIGWITKALISSPYKEWRKINAKHFYATADRIKIIEKTGDDFLHEHTEFLGDHCWKCLQQWGKLNTDKIKEKVNHCIFKKAQDSHYIKEALHGKLTQYMPAYCSHYPFTDIDNFWNKSNS